MITGCSSSSDEHVRTGKEISFSERSALAARASERNRFSFGMMYM